MHEETDLFPSTQSFPASAPCGGHGAHLELECAAISDVAVADDGVSDWVAAEVEGVDVGFCGCAGGFDDEGLGCAREVDGDFVEERAVTTRVLEIAPEGNERIPYLPMTYSPETGLTG